MTVEYNYKIYKLADLEVREHALVGERQVVHLQPWKTTLLVVPYASRDTNLMQCRHQGIQVECYQEKHVECHTRQPGRKGRTFHRSARRRSALSDSASCPMQKAMLRAAAGSCAKRKVSHSLALFRQQCRVGNVSHWTAPAGQRRRRCRAAAGPCARA